MLIGPGLAAAVVVVGALAVAGSVRAGWVPRRAVPVLRIPVALLAAVTVAVEGPWFLLVLAFLMLATGYVAWCYWSASPDRPGPLQPRWFEPVPASSPVPPPIPAPARELPPCELWAVALEHPEGQHWQFRTATRMGPGTAVALAIERLAEELDLDPEVLLRGPGRLTDYTVESLGQLSRSDIPLGVVTDPYED